MCVSESLCIRVGVCVCVSHLSVRRPSEQCVLCKAGFQSRSLDMFVIRGEVQREEERQASLCFVCCHNQQSGKIKTDYEQLHPHSVLTGSGSG